MGRNHSTAVLASQICALLGCWEANQAGKKRTEVESMICITRVQWRFLDLSTLIKITKSIHSLLVVLEFNKSKIDKLPQGSWTRVATTPLDAGKLSWGAEKPTKPERFVILDVFQLEAQDVIEQKIENKNR